MKGFAKMLMVLESNNKAIRPCSEALTNLLIELRLNGPVNNISVMLGLLGQCACASEWRSCFSWDNFRIFWTYKTLFG